MHLLSSFILPVGIETNEFNKWLLLHLFKSFVLCCFLNKSLGLLPRDASLDGAVVVVVSKAESPSSTTTIIVPLVPLVEPRIHTARFSAGLSSWCPDSAPFAHC